MTGTELQPLGPRPVLSTKELERFRQRLQFSTKLFPSETPTPAATTPTNDPDIQAWVQRTNEKTDADFMAVMRQEVKQNPDLAAEVKKMSLDLGIDREVIKNNIDGARRAMALVQMREKEIVRNSPLLTAFATNPDLAAIAHDDLDNLAKIESWGRQWDAGLLEVERGELGVKLAQLEPGSSDYEVVLGRMELVEAYLAATPHSTSFLTAPARMFGQMYETSPLSFAAGIGATALVGAFTGGVGTAAVAAGTISSAAVGGYQTAIIEGGNAFRDYTLSGMDREIAKSMAMQVAITNGIIEVGGGLIPAGQLASAGRNLVRRVVGKGLAKGTTRRSIRRAVTGYALSYGSELVEEAGQESMTAIFESMGMDATEELREQIGKTPGVFNLPSGGTITTLEDGSVVVSADVYERYTGKLVDGDQTISGDQVDRLVDDMGRLYPLERTLSKDNYYEDLWNIITSTMGSTAVAAWLPALPGPILQFASDRKRVRTAKRVAESIEKLSDLADGTKLSRRDATSLSDFIQSVLKGKSLETLFVDRTDLEGLLKEAGVTIEELDKILPGVKDQMALDAEVAPSIEIKPSDLATKLKDYEILPQLLELVRANDPEALSRKEATEKSKEFAKKEKEHRKKLDQDQNRRRMQDTFLEAVEERTEYELTEAIQTTKGRKPNAEERAQIKAAAAFSRNYVYQQAVQRGVDVSQIDVVRTRGATEKEELRAQGTAVRETEQAQQQTEQQTEQQAETIETFVQDLPETPEELRARMDRMFDAREKADEEMRARGNTVRSTTPGENENPPTRPMTTDDITTVEQADRLLEELATRRANDIEQASGGQVPKLDRDRARIEARRAQLTGEQAQQQTEQQQAEVNNDDLKEMTKSQLRAEAKKHPGVKRNGKGVTVQSLREGIAEARAAETQAQQQPQANTLESTDSGSEDARFRKAEGELAPGNNVSKGNKLGFWEKLRVRILGQELPEKASVTQTTTNANAVAQLAAVDAILAAHPDAHTSLEAWARMQAEAFASEEVPVPPYAFIRDLAGSRMADNLRRLSDGQIEDAAQGFENAALFRKLYTEGKIDVETTGKLFLWSFLSRGVSPYTQESLFIDAFKGAEVWIKKAAAGEFKESDFAAYTEWAKGVAPKGSGMPGASSTHNLNAFGRSFLFKMGQKKDGVTGLQRLHDMMSDPQQTGRQIRRKFAEMSQGVGIDNKVVSFTLLVAGFTDVMVLDRVQVRQLWDDGRFNGYNLYDGVKTKRIVKGKEKQVAITGSALTDLTMGARGILIYEAVERALDAKVQEIYTELGRPQDASVGRYHWESWVAESEQEASHGTLEAILDDARGADNAIARVQAKQGEYATYEYGARYFVTEQGESGFVYSAPNGTEYTFDVPTFRGFLDAIKKPKNQVVPPGTKIKDPESGKTKTKNWSIKENTKGLGGPWWSHPDINQGQLDKLAAKWSGPDGRRLVEKADRKERSEDADGSGGRDGDARFRKTEQESRAAEERRGGVRGVVDGGTDALRDGDPASFGNATVLGRLGDAGFEVAADEQGRTEFAQRMRTLLPDAQGNNGNKFYASVTFKNPGDLEGAQLFLSASGNAGVAISADGELQAGWAAPGTPPGEGIALMRAVLDGANSGQVWATSFATKLPELYSAIGFRPVSRTPFNREFAPRHPDTDAPIWDYQLYERWQNGEPDVVFYVFDGGEDNEYSDAVREGLPSLDDYDAAEAIAKDQTERARADDQGATAEGRKNLSAAGEGTVFGEFDPASMEVILFRRHNIATFFHEFAHFHFEVMTREYRQGRATQQMIDDLTAVALWSGYESLEDYARSQSDLTKDVQRRRAAHEAFAYSFELYLYENKVPNVGMRGVFRRVASWLAKIYGGDEGIKNRLNLAYRSETRSKDYPDGKNLPALTPEVVAVMDRLTASEEEIENAMRQGAIGRVLELLASPAFGDVTTASLKASGKIPEKDLELLGNLFDDAKGKAKEVLRARLMKDLEYLRRFESRRLREMQSRSKKVRKAVEEDEREQLLVRERVARLQHWLKTGEVLGVDETNEQGPVLVRGDQQKKAKHYLITEDSRVPAGDRRKSDFGDGANRVSPEMAMEMFGYDSVDDMFDDLSIARPIEEEVQALADARMKAEYSELNTAEAMQEAVREAVNTEAMLRFYESHARAELQQERDLRMTPKGKLELRRAAKEVARRVVRSQDVSNLAALAKRYAQEADRTYVRALQSLDAEKKQALLRSSIQQRALAVEAYETRAMIESGKAKLAQRLRDTGASRNKSLAKTYGGATVATVREILRMFGIDMGNKLRQEEGAMPWDDLVVANEDQVADDPLVADLQLAYLDMSEVAKESGNNFDNLTVEKADTILNAMQGLLTRGRESQTFVLDNQRIALNDLIRRLEKMAEERGIPEPSLEPRERSAIATSNSRWQRLEALLLAIDGGKAGVLTQNIWEPAMRAAVELETAEVEILKLFDEALEPLRQQMKRNGRMAEPIVSKIITHTPTGKPYVFKNGKQDIIGMLLHLGNTSNRKRLVSGWEWDDDAVTLQVRKWEEDGTITEEDWKIVSNIWAIYDKMLPKTKQAFFAIEGYSMEIVETSEVETSFGTIKGGYVPAAADTSVITNVKANQQEIDQKGSWSASLPTVQSGMTKQRTQGPPQRRALDLNLLRQQQHFHAHLLYSYMGPALARIQQFVGNKEVRVQLERIQPGIYSEFLNDWLETVGTQSTSLSKNQDVTGLDWFASHMRRSAGTAAMFANVKNSIQGISGLALAIARVNPGALLLAVGDYMTSPLRSKQEINEKSAYMRLRHREGNSVYEVRDKVQDLLLSQNMIVRGGQKLSKWMAKNTYWMQEIIQKPVDRIVWLGAYKQELDEGGTEERAILAGDAAVRQTQGDTMAISLATGEKGTATIKMFTQFMSWFIMMGSLRADFTVAQPEGRSRVAAAAPMVMTMFVTMVIGELVTEALDQLSSEAEDEEERVRRSLGQTAIRVTLNSIIAPLRMFGLSGAFSSTIAATMFNMDAYQQRMPSPPALSVVMRALREGKQMVAGEDPFSTEDVLDFGEAMMILLGAGGIVAGTRRVRRGLGVGVELERGEEPLDVSGLITGYR